MTSRPLDVLDKAKGKRVILKLKNGAEINGVLQAFDLHLNIWLEEAIERLSEIGITEIFIPYPFKEEEIPKFEYFAEEMLPGLKKRYY